MIVGDEYRKQARGIGITSICTNQVCAAGRLKECLTGAINPRWPSRGILRANLSGEYIGEDAAGMAVRWRAASGSVLDQIAVRVLPGTFGSWTEKTV